MPFAIVLDPRAVEDIQESIDYYEEQQSGLGKAFENSLDEHFSVLEKNPFFQVRYDNVHCLPQSKFPHMIHFTVNEEDKKVTVRAVFHTSRDSKSGTYPNSVSGCLLVRLTT